MWKDFDLPVVVPDSHYHAHESDCVLQGEWTPAPVRSKLNLNRPSAMLFISPPGCAGIWTCCNFPPGKVGERRCQRARWVDSTKVHKTLPVWSVPLHLSSLMNRIFAGIFFILPCIDAYARVDLRTRTYDVPPQEVSTFLVPRSIKSTFELSHIKAKCSS